MPPSRVRRRPPSSRQSAPPPSKETEEYVASTDEVDVVEPVVDAPAAEEAPAEASEQPAEGSGGSRRAASSVRRTTRRQSTTGPSVSSRRVLTPEQRAERRRSAFLVVKILLLLIVLGGAAFGAWWLMGHKSVALLTAEKQMAEAEKYQKGIELSIRNRDPNSANEAYDKALKSLAHESLANASNDHPEPDLPNLGSVDLAIRAFNLKQMLIKDYKPQIERIERDIKAESNEKDLNDRFAKLNKIDDAALAELEKQCGKFMDNPVDPEAGRNESYVSDYKPLVIGINSRQLSLRQEQNRRRENITSQPEKDAHQDAELLVKEEKFGDALSKIADYQNKFKDAKFDNVEAFVKAAAENAWSSASNYAENNYKTFTSPGTSESIRQEALQNAKKRMDEVVERFGIDEYVSKAKEALAKYQR